LGKGVREGLPRMMGFHTIETERSKRETTSEVLLDNKDDDSLRGEEWTWGTRRIIYDSRCPEGGSKKYRGEYIH